MLALLVAGQGWAGERARRVLEAHRRGLRTAHIIAGNRHDVYALAAAAKVEGLDPAEVLRSSILARAFTAHQLAALLEDTLPVLMADRLGLVAVVDPLDQYANTEEVAEEEGIALLQRGLAKLRLLARRRPDLPLLVVQHPGAGERKHWELLEAAVESVVLPPGQAPRQRQQVLTTWMPQRVEAEGGIVQLDRPRPERAPEVMPLGPHHAHVPQPA